MMREIYGALFFCCKLPVSVSYVRDICSHSVLGNVHSSSWKLSLAWHDSLVLSGQATDNLAVTQVAILESDSLINFFAIFTVYSFRNFLLWTLQRELPQSRLCRTLTFKRILCPHQSMYSHFSALQVGFLLNANPWYEMTAQKFTGVCMCPQESSSYWHATVETVNVDLKILYLLMPGLTVSINPVLHGCCNSECAIKASIIAVFRELIGSLFSSALHSLTELCSPLPGFIVLPPRSRAVLWSTVCSHALLCRVITIWGEKRHQWLPQIPEVSCLESLRVRTLYICIFYYEEMFKWYMQLLVTELRLPISLPSFQKHYDL